MPREAKVDPPHSKNLMKIMILPIRSLCLIGCLVFASAASAQTSTTYLLDFGSSGASVYASSNTAGGDINYMLGAQNGTGFNVDTIVGVTSPGFGGGSGTIGENYSFGSYTLTTTSVYGSYNIGSSSTDNTGVYGDFFLTSGATPVTFDLSGFNATDTITIAFLHSQPWTITLSASTTSNFSSNVVSASSTGSVGQTTTFFNLSGSLTGGSHIYTSFISTGAGEGDLSGMIINVTTAAAVPEPSTYAAIFGAAALGYVMIRRRRR